MTSHRQDDEVSMNAEQTMLEAFKRRPTVEMSTWYKGILVSHLATEKDTGGAFDLVMSRMRSGTEPPPHIHEREHEVFYVLEGELEVWTVSMLCDGYRSHASQAI
jgi:quercetin dioxygenase-like cupin family protein